MNNYLQADANSALESSRFMTRVYNWMVLALAVSWWIAYYVGTDINLVRSIVQWGFFIPLIILEFALVIIISWWINKINAATAIALFILYSAVNWFTLSIIFMVYQIPAIVNAFLITAGTFWFMSFYWYTTKSDLTWFGSYMRMWLVGIIIALIVNIFIGSSLVDFIISCFWVLVFTWLTAYDTQKIKEMNIIGNEWTEEDKKEAIMWALSLYLDFINLFLFILRIFGSRD